MLKAKSGTISILERVFIGSSFPMHRFNTGDGRFVSVLDEGV